MVGACRCSQDGKVCCHQLSPGQSCLTCRNRIKPFPKWPPRWFSTVYHNSCKEMRQFNGKPPFCDTPHRCRSRRAEPTAQGGKKKRNRTWPSFSVGTDCEIIKNANPGHNKYFLHYCFCSLKHRGITTKIDILNCMHHELIHVTVPTAVSACADVPVLKSWLEDRMTARHGAQHYTVLRQVTLPV